MDSSVSGKSSTIAKGRRSWWPEPHNPKGVIVKEYKSLAKKGAGKIASAFFSFFASGICAFLTLPDLQVRRA